MLIEEESPSVSSSVSMSEKGKKRSDVILKVHPTYTENLLKSFLSRYSAIINARKVIYSKGSLQDLLRGTELVRENYFWMRVKTIKKPKKIHLFGRLDPSVLRFEQSLVILMLKKVKMFTDLNDDDQVQLLNPLEI